MNLSTNTQCKKDIKGVTLIELLVALVISGILIAALYRTFIGQQKVYIVQEQVVDMQQNTRAAISRMIREIRMAGFGNVSNVLPVNGFTQVFTMNPNNLTIVGGFKQIKDSTPSEHFITVLSTVGNQITLSAATKEFDGAAHGYISIGGLASYKVNQPTGTTAVLTLDRTPTLAVGAYIFKVQAITYTCGLVGGKPVLQRDENTGSGPQSLADNIENIQFAYFDSNGNQTAIPANVTMISLAVTARTDMSDPNLKGGDGYRRRTISSNVQLRDLGLTS